MPSKESLERLLEAEIATPCSYHPAGRNSLFLNPLEREVIVKRIQPVLDEAIREARYNEAKWWARYHGKDYNGEGAARLAQLEKR